MADVVKMRGKNANKVATKRLRTAYKLLTAGKQAEFYDEVLRALWGYVGDKFNLPVEHLSRENISELLAAKGVEDATIKQFVGAIDECEYERYAPGDAKGNMNKTFESAMTAIMNIEETVKKGKKSATVVLLMLLVLIPSSSFAQKSLKALGDEAYGKGNYQQAINDYEQLLKQGVSADN